MNEKDLVKKAFDARKNSYSPYSGFCVGAALLCVNGKIYTGCNIENASFSPTCCAERTAFFKAVSDGEKEFEAIAVVGGKKGSDECDFCPPCGVCRQVMNEFCSKDFKIIMAKNPDDILVVSLKELLPGGFSLESNKIV